MWWILWLGLALLLLSVELLTFDLVSIWFSVAALILSIITVIVPELYWVWQIVIFAALSAILFILTRPMVKSFLKRRKSQATNLELIVGTVGIVEEEIANDFAKGTVKLNGLVWSARSETGEKIETGTFVVVQKIDGNKLIVIERKEKEEK